MRGVASAAARRCVRGCRPAGDDAVLQRTRRPQKRQKPAPARGAQDREPSAKSPSSNREPAAHPRIQDNVGGSHIGFGRIPARAAEILMLCEFVDWRAAVTGLERARGVLDQARPPQWPVRRGRGTESDRQHKREHETRTPEGLVQGGEHPLCRLAGLLRQDGKRADRAWFRRIGSTIRNAPLR